MENKSTSSPEVISDEEIKELITMIFRFLKDKSYGKQFVESHTLEPGKSGRDEQLLLSLHETEFLATPKGKNSIEYSLVAGWFPSRHSMLQVIASYHAWEMTNHGHMFHRGDHQVTLEDLEELLNGREDEAFREIVKTTYRLTEIFDNTLVALRRFVTD